MTADELKKQYHREYQKKWRKNNRNKINTYQNQWRSNNRDKVKKYNNDYWQKKADNITVEEKISMMRHQNMSLRNIAEVLNISKSKVHRITNAQ